MTVTDTVLLLGGPGHGNLVPIKRGSGHLPYSVPALAELDPSDTSELAPAPGRYDLRRYAMYGRTPATIGLSAADNVVAPGGAIRVDWRVATLPDEEWRAEEHYRVVVFLLAVTGRLELGGSSAEVSIAEPLLVGGRPLYGGL